MIARRDSGDSIQVLLGRLDERHKAVICIVGELLRRGAQATAPISSERDRFWCPRGVQMPILHACCLHSEIATSDEIVRLLAPNPADGSPVYQNLGACLEATIAHLTSDRKLLRASVVRHARPDYGSFVRPIDHIEVFSSPANRQRKLLRLEEAQDATVWVLVAGSRPCPIDVAAEQGGFDQALDSATMTVMLDRRGTMAACTYYTLTDLGWAVFDAMRDADASGQAAAGGEASEDGRRLPQQDERTRRYSVANETTANEACRLMQQAIRAMTQIFVPEDGHHRVSPAELEYADGIFMSCARDAATIQKALAYVVYRPESRSGVTNIFVALSNWTILLRRSDGEQAHVEALYSEIEAALKLIELLLHLREMGEKLCRFDYGEEMRALKDSQAWPRFQAYCEPLLEEALLEAAQPAKETQAPPGDTAQPESEQTWRPLDEEEAELLCDAVCYATEAGVVPENLKSDTPIVVVLPPPDESPTMATETTKGGDTEPGGNGTGDADVEDEGAESSADRDVPEYDATGRWIDAKSTARCLFKVETGREPNSAELKKRVDRLRGARGNRDRQSGNMHVGVDGDGLFYRKRSAKIVCYLYPPPNDQSTEQASATSATVARA